jgi:hypothetical protein
MALRQSRVTKCVKMRVQFVRLPDSKTYLMRLNTNILCLTPLTRRSRAAGSRTRTSPAAQASHGDTKTRRKLLDRTADLLSASALIKSSRTIY